MKLTSLAIRLIFINAFILSIVVMQAVMQIDIFPKHLEPFVYGIVICLQIVVASVYLSAMLSEIKGIKDSLAPLAELVRNEEE